MTQQERFLAITLGGLDPNDLPNVTPKRRGPQPKPTPAADMTVKQKEKIRELHQAGQAVDSLARKFRTTVEDVRQVLAGDGNHEPKEGSS